MKTYDVKRKNRVLITVGSLGIGGNESFVMNLYRNIGKDNFEIDFVIYSDDGISHQYLEEINKGIGKIFILHNTGKGKVLRFLCDIKDTAHIIRSGNYDILHSNSCSFLGILRSAIPGYLTKHVKVIAHSHNSGNGKKTYGDKLSRYFLKLFLCRIVDVGCACSDVAGQSKYTKKFMNSNRYMMIKNAVETSAFRFNEKVRDEIRNGLGINKDELVIGNVGRLAYQKNHEFLLKILLECLAAKKSIKLLILGEGDLHKELEEKALEMKLGGHVIWAGNKSDINRYYQAMDYFVLPSKYEGFPFALVEAQMNGLYCLVSDVVSKEVNVSGTVNFLPLDKGARYWAEKIMQLPKGRMPLENVNKVIEQYNIKEEIRRIEDMYSNLINER